MIKKELEERVKEIFAGDHSGHDFAHTQRVIRLTQKIAEAEGANTEIAALAALLHDVDDHKLTGGEFGCTERARKLLCEFGYTEETADRVCEAIRTVSFKGTDTEKPKTIEGMAVQDADRLDAIGAIGIARAFAYGSANARPMYDPDIPPAAEMSAEEYKKSRSTTINHFYEKLLLIKDMMNTEAAKSIAEERHGFLLSFLDRFYSEWNGEK